jgi:hypothetical protein
MVNVLDSEVAAKLLVSPNNPLPDPWPQISGNAWRLSGSATFWKSIRGIS